MALSQTPVELKEKFRPFDFEPERFIHRRWTYDELLRELPETNAHVELWEGKLIVSPSPGFFHQKLMGEPSES